MIKELLLSSAIIAAPLLHDNLIVDTDNISTNTTYVYMTTASALSEYYWDGVGDSDIWLADDDGYMLFQKYYIDSDYVKHYLDLVLVGSYYDADIAGGDYLNFYPIDINNDGDGFIEFCCTYDTNNYVNQYRFNADGYFNDYGFYNYEIYVLSPRDLHLDNEFDGYFTNISDNLATNPSNYAPSLWRYVYDSEQPTYADGYSNGYENGYENGYSLGLSDGMNEKFDFLSVFDAFFTYELFPGFKLYYILVFSLGLMIFKLVAHMVF